MSIIFIGNPAVGKTTLAVELARPADSKSQVQVIEPTYADLLEILYSRSFYTSDDGTEATRSTIEARATDRRKVKELKIQVELPTGVRRTLSVQWVDTPGELWERIRTSSSQDHFREWQELVSDIQTADGVVLVLAPHRNRIDPQRLQKADAPFNNQPNNFLEYNDWKEQFDWWLKFLTDHTSVHQQIIICLNQVDLILNCDYEAVARQLPLASFDRDLGRIQEQFLKDYFEEVRTSIDRYNSLTDGNPLNVCITTKYNRVLLELPWIYLARFLRK